MGRTVSRDEVTAFARALGLGFASSSLSRTMGLLAFPKDGVSSSEDRTITSLGLPGSFTP